MKIEPTTGKILYRPVREVTWPDSSEAAIIPPTSGRMSSPALVGEAPLTICRYSGIEAMPPNIPMPMIVAWAEPTAKTLPRNSRSGSSASSPISASIADEGQPARSTPSDVADEGAARGPAPCAALLGDDQQRHETGGQCRRAAPVDAVVAAGVVRCSTRMTTNSARMPIGTLM